MSTRRILILIAGVLAGLLALLVCDSGDASAPENQSGKQGHYLLKKAVQTGRPFHHFRDTLWSLYSPLG